VQSLMNRNGILTAGAGVGYLVGSRTVITTTGAGTYTVPTGCRAILVELIGGGGNGANAANSSAAQIVASSAGAGGGYCVSPLLFVTPGKTFGVGVSAGAGSSSFSVVAGQYTLIGGSGQNGAASIATGTAEAFGTVQFTSTASSGGEIIAASNGSQNAHRVSGTVAVSARGGGGPWGGSPVNIKAQGNGTPGGKYGGGGGGALSVNAAGATTGGAGGQGLIIVWEFYQA